MDCQFTQAAANTWKCQACGWVYQGEQSPRKNCGKAPGFVAKASRYAVAVARWIAAGRPTRSDSEAQAILEGICQPCEHYTDKGACRLCGCCLTGKSGLTSKILMATQSCSAGKWQAVVESPPVEVERKEPCSSC